MIYEADAGQNIHSAAKEAIKSGCNKMVFNNELYTVKIVTEKLNQYIT